MSFLGFDALGRLALGQLPQTAVAPAARTLTFGSAWTAPRKAGLAAAVIATTFAGFVAPPQARATTTFNKFSEPFRKANLALLATWQFSPAAPRTTQTAIFTKFSQPQIPRVNLPDEQPSALFEVRPPPVISIAFTQFSQPIVSRANLSDEQPSTLFEVLPPIAPPFTGFARFEGIIRAKLNVALYSTPLWLPTIAPAVDTHDGVWVKRKRKKLDRDPLELEIEEKAKRRAAIELAVYGPEVTYEPPAPSLFAPTVQPPPNVEDLTRAIMAAKQMQEQQQRVALEQDDEDVLEMILRDL